VLVLLALLVGAVSVSPSAALAGGLCPNEAFRVGPSAALPDCRAYEMVTPVFKNAGDVTDQSAPLAVRPLVEPDGQALTIRTTASFAGTTGNTTGFGSPYLLSRTDSGWVTTPMELPESQFYTFGLNFGYPSTFGGSLDGQVEALMVRNVSKPGNTIDIYRGGADGSVVDVGPVLPPTAPYESIRALAASEGVDPSGISGDGLHVFFSTTHQHWPFDETNDGTQSLYEYSGTGNTEPMLVAVDNSGKLLSTCGAVLGGAQEPRVSNNSKYSQTEMGHNDVSADGRVVFFTAVGCGPSLPANEVFARIDNGLSDAKTVAISEPSHEDCEECNTSAPAEALFEGASADGSKVFFSTRQALLGGDETANLYEYDFSAPAGHKIIRVTGGDSSVSNPTAGMIGEVAGISEDGSHVYFGATGVLTRTPNGEGQVARPGATNLYVFERDARYPAGHTAFVAPLDPRDAEMFMRFHFSNAEYPRGANVTPDGRFLVFRSEADLTPDDTSTVAQIFEYDSLTERLVRVSIGQNGFNENGNTSVYPAEIPSPLENYKEMGMNIDPRVYWSNMASSADGSYVFFTSGDALTPGALQEPGSINGVNVYEFHDGNVHLIARASKKFDFGPIIGTDASGQDVFFRSTDQLAPQDTDTDGDIYDARINGGFPAPVTPGECSGDACQGPLAGAPVLLSPGSEFQVGGNPSLAGSPPARKSTVKKNARSKKEKAKRKKRARKSGHRRLGPRKGKR
jgi:hypothetical protein